MHQKRTGKPHEARCKPRGSPFKLKWIGSQQKAECILREGLSSEKTGRSEGGSASLFLFRD
ncbi:MAG: hypothetical protein EGQ34_01255 [Sutterella sp.]|nr:hypothetical protein [Sutterella sp.]